MRQRMFTFRWRVNVRCPLFRATIGLTAAGRKATATLPCVSGNAHREVGRLGHPFGGAIIHFALPASTSAT